MKAELAFDIGLQDYFVRQLTLEDSEEIQGVWDKCLDFMLLVEGHPAEPNYGVEQFQDVPPGKSTEDLFVFGIFNRQNDLVGLLDVLRGYPDEITWWIGLLIFIPDFAEYVRLNSGQAIMLGVVEENQLASAFWKKMGFELVRKTEPRQFGNKTQSVNIMRRVLL
jgi:hypothetical protein